MNTEPGKRVAVSTVGDDLRFSHSCSSRWRHSRAIVLTMLLSYETVKYVSIRDSRLGVLRYCLVAAIVVYVGVFELWAFGGWLASSPVDGAVRFSLQQPTENGCDPFGADETCRNAFAPLNQLPYCEQSSAAVNYEGNVYPCEIYEAINAQIVTETSLVVVTRAATANQTLVCGNGPLKNMTCPQTYETFGGEHKFYTAQSEAFTVLVDHAVTASQICNDHLSSYACSAASSDFLGRLYSNNPELCREQHALNMAFRRNRGTKQTQNSPCYIQPNRTVLQQDFFSLDVLLRAAGVTLDDCVSNVTAKCQTYRDAGATLLLNIVWNDFTVYRGKSEPHYSYRTSIVGRSFKMSVPYYESYREKRTLFTAHGIRIAVLLGGEFHKFELVSFLITVTTALGLLAVSTTVVDSLMLYILPEKERYAQAKYESTGELFETQTIPQIVNHGLSAILGSREHGNTDTEVNDSNVNERPGAGSSLEEPFLKDGSPSS
jgi:ATP P2X receptor